MRFCCSKGRKKCKLFYWRSTFLHSSSSNKLGTKMTEADSFTNYSWIAAMVQIPLTFKSTFGSLHLEIMHLEILLPEVSLLFIFFQCFSVLRRMSWEDEWMLQFKWVTLERERDQGINNCKKKSAVKIHTSSFWLNSLGGSIEHRTFSNIWTSLSINQHESYCFLKSEHLAKLGM